MPSKAHTPSEGRHKESLKTAKKKKKDKNNKTVETFDEDDDHKKKGKKGKKDKRDVSRDSEEKRNKKHKDHHKKDDKEPKKKKKKERTVELDTEGVPTAHIMGPMYKKSKPGKDKSSSEKKQKAPSVAKEVTESEHQDQKAKSPLPDPASPSDDKAKDKKSEEKMPPSSEDQKEKVKTVVQQAAAPNIIILNYGTNNAPAGGGKMVATQQDGNIVLRPEGAPAGPALDAAIAAATGQQANQNAVPDVAENIKKVSNLEPNYMNLEAVGNNEQVLDADKNVCGKDPLIASACTKSGGTKKAQPTNLVADHPNDNDQYANLTPPQQLPPVISSYMKPGSAGGLQSMHVAAPQPNENEQYANLAPPTQQLPSIYVNSPGGRAQSAYLSPPAAGTFKPLVMGRSPKHKPSKSGSIFP